MSRPHRRFALAAQSLLFALLGGLALSAPAAADRSPEHSTFRYETPVLDAGDCDGDPIVHQFSVAVSETLWFDAAGEPLRYHHWREYTGTVTNTVTGVSLPAGGVRVISEHLRTGAWKVTGAGIHVIAPGSGTVALDAGQILEDADFNVVRETGRRLAIVNEEVCAALK